ncbi:hypothetical protein OFY17_03700 [Marinomonas sp. C2222]|uniref:Tetratricopeptide repeat protein n=1 Tax=Marinomonas sargassi TaxID=2984494 RepID=A0ABT2YQ28_9GAMM|nr:hypothetical protein [Marinomonas sargassi]MCV2401985.1 hypothetical protein [Marinomonas sargassi]
MSLKKLNHKNKQRFSALLKEATHHLKVHQYQAALQAYKKIYNLTHDPRSLQLQGLCLYKLNQLDEAISVSELALAKFKQIGQLDVPTLENLTEVYGIHGDVEKSHYYGKKCLQAKDSLAMKGAKSFQLLEASSSLGKKQVFSFSLFGASPRYCENAILNVKAVQQIFPDFICRFYIDESVPKQVQSRLVAEKAEVVLVESDFRPLPGTMWRFLALDDEEVAVVICRDADSVVSMREKAIVEEWLSSDFKAHVIRDFPSHCELLLAGLFGIKRGAISPIKGAMLGFVEAAKNGRYTDQQFLRHCIWPQIKLTALTHDRCFQFGEHMGTEALPSPASSTDHIGSNLGAKSISLSSDLPDGSHVEFYFVFDSHDKRGPYQAVVKNKSWSSPIPDAYIDSLNEKSMTIEWKRIAS